VPQAGPRADDNPFTARERTVAGDPATLLRLRLRWKEPAASESRLLEADVPAAAGAMDGEFRFAAAVAAFGMILRDSPWKGAATLGLVDELARAGRGEDPRGQRREFIDLVARARELAR